MIEINNKRLCESCFAELETEGSCPYCGFDSKGYAPDMAVLPVGTVLNGNILIGRLMGKGGFGVTYSGCDLRTGKTVAVKEYYPNGIAYRSGTMVLAADPRSKEKFEKGTEKFYSEAETVTQFNGCPNIVGVYDYFRANNTVYLIMESLNGVTLKNYVKKHGRITDGQALFVMDKMAAALSIIHSANILHRDISPDNIMVCLDGKIKLIDFGAARQVTDKSSSDLTVMMKSGYTPIEQYTKKGRQGPWTDIYALGASVYYAITGKVIDDPYERLENDTEFASNIHGINNTLWNVIKRCTMINASERFGSAIDLRMALKATSAPLKAEPIVIDNNYVKLDDEVVEPKAALDNPAVPESIEMFAGSDDGDKTAEKPDLPSYKQKKSKKSVSAIASAAGVLLAAAIVWIIALTGDMFDNRAYWRAAAALPKDELQAYGSDVKVTVEVKAASNDETVPCMRVLWDEGKNAADLITGDSLRLLAEASEPIYEVRDGTFAFYVSKENIETLTQKGLELQVHNAAVGSAAVTPVITVEIDSEFPGCWKESGGEIASDILRQFTGDVKVTLAVEYVEADEDQVNGEKIYYRHLEIRDLNGDVLDVNAFNITWDEYGHAYYLGSYPAEISDTHHRFEFVIPNDLMDSISNGIYFVGNNAYVVSAAVEAYDAAEDAVSRDAVILEPEVTDFSNNNEFTEFISKNLLESFGVRDIRVTVSIEENPTTDDGMIHIGTWSDDGKFLYFSCVNHDPANIWPSYCIGHYTTAPKTVTFVISSQQIQELNRRGFNFTISNAHIKAVYLEPA